MSIRISTKSRSTSRLIYWPLAWPRLTGLMCHGPSTPTETSKSFTSLITPRHEDHPDNFRLVWWLRQSQPEQTRVETSTRRTRESYWKGNDKAHGAYTVGCERSVEMSSKRVCKRNNTRERSKVYANSWEGQREWKMSLCVEEKAVMQRTGCKDNLNNSM